MNFSPQRCTVALAVLLGSSAWALLPGCDENFNDIYIGYPAGASGQSGASGQGGSPEQPVAGQAGTGGAGQGGSGGAGQAGAASGGQAGGCSTGRCTGTLLEACQNGILLPPQDCNFECRPEGCLSVSQITGGARHTCALLSDGSVRCWGDNTHGQSSESQDTTTFVPTAAKVSDIHEVVAGGQHTCVRQGTGKISCWGGNSDGQLGNDASSAQVQSAAPLPVELPKKALSLALGEAHTCALLEGGAIACWGRGDKGQLGDEVADPSNVARTPRLLKNPPKQVLRLAAGGDQTCAMLASGAVWCWGGEAAILQPQPISSILEATYLSVGPRHGCAIRNGDSLRCWGANDRGQLGNDAVGIDSPGGVVVENQSGMVVTGVLDAGVGDVHACLLLNSQSVQCWGANDQGELGANEGVDFDSAVTVPGLVGAVSLAVGAHHSCAITQQGQQVRCWGANAQAQLGGGNASASQGLTSVVW